MFKKNLKKKVQEDSGVEQDTVDVNRSLFVTAVKLCFRAQVT